MKPRAFRSLAPAVLCGVLAVLGGCRTLTPRLVAPALTLVAVNIQGGNLQSAQLQLTLHIDNPNDRGISVGSLDAQLELAGQPFATGVNDMPFTLPPHGQTDVVLDVTANLSNALVIGADVMLHRMVSYHLYGQVHLQHELLVHTLNFNRYGQVQLR